MPENPKDIVKVGVVGTGWIAGSMGLFFKCNKPLKITAARDAKPDHLQTFTKRSKVRETYADFDAMLVKADVDALYLATPPHTHIFLDQV